MGTTPAAPVPDVPTPAEVEKLTGALKNPREPALSRKGAALRLHAHGLLPAELAHHLPPPEEPEPPPKPIALAYESPRPQLRTRLGKVCPRTDRAEAASIAEALADELGGDPDYYLEIVREVIAGRGNRLVRGYDKAKGRGVTSKSGTFGYYARGGTGGPAGPAITGRTMLTGGAP